MRLQSELEITPSNAEPLLFFDRLRSAYQEAIATAGVIERYFSVAEYTLCLKFAGPALLDSILPALNHLECEPVSHPDLTVLLCDSVSTHTSIPPPAWGPDDYREAGEIRGFCNERFYTVYQIYPQILTMLDAERATALYWVKDTRNVPLYVRGAPLRILFNAWLGRQDLFLLHSGAVGYPNGGVLVTGKEGAGKSNTALACLNSDLLYLSDDYCLLANNLLPVAHSLYNTAKLYPHDLSQLPFLSAIQNSWTDSSSDKILYFLHEFAPAKLIRTLPIRAILLPRVTGSWDTRVEPTTAAASLWALAPTTLLNAPGFGNAIMSRLAQLVRAVPSFELQLGTDRKQIPRVISNLLTLL